MSAQQIYQEKFGANRVQHEKFLWQYISTYNFDIYFHYGGEELARTTADFAEREISRISKELDYTSYRKYKIFIYNSVDDIEQSNIGLETGNFIGGQTAFVKPIMEVAFEGNVNEFKGQVSFGIAKTLMNFMMYGGSLKDVFRSSFFLALPEWYMNGAAAFIAYGWNSEMDNYIRKKVSVEKLHSPASYRGEEATLIGHAAWNYINEVYGHEGFQRLIDLTRIYRKEKKCIELGLNVPYKQFVKDWRAFYKDEADNNAEFYDLADRSIRVKKRNRIDRKYYEVKTSSKSSYLAYATNTKGKYRVFVKDLKKNRTRQLRTGGYKRYDQMVGYNNPALAWNQDDILSVVTYKKGKAHHKQYDFKTGKRKVRGLGDFQQTLSFSYSDDGELVLISGDTRGKTDIWIWDLTRNNLKQLTLDPYNDLDPVFLPNSRFEFVYASSRPLNEGEADSLLNLFYFDYRNGKIKPLTSEGNNHNPAFKSKDELYFISDRTGINNIFSYTLSTGELKQVTHFYYDVKSFTISQEESNVLSYVLNEGGRDFMYIDSLSNYTPQALSPYTSLAKKRGSSGTVESTGVTDSLMQIDNEDINFDKLIFESERELLVKKEEELKREAFSKSELIKVKGPYKYKKLFSVDQITTSLMVDPLRGLGILLDGQMSDLLQQNRFNLGLFIISDFSNSNMYAEYMMLKHRVDFKFRFDRQAYTGRDSSVIQRYKLNKGTVEIAYPINPHHRISLIPFVAQTRFADVSDNIAILTDDVTNLYTGAKVEWVYDFTRYYGLNMKAGNMAKVSFEKYIHESNAKKNFAELVVDIRHYQPIHKALLLALRVSYGQFVGNAPKNYMLGGMDNWIVNQTDQSNPNSPLYINYQQDNSDIMFNKYTMSMRGFKYNTQFGHKHFLFNAELRFPIAQYLYKGTIGSAFIRNLQLVAFTDMGSAWDGNTPFDTKKVITEPPFKAVVTNYNNPFLMSYGGGIRSLLIGYYMKLDLAWGVQNNIVHKPMLHFTLGHDF